MPVYLYHATPYEIAKKIAGNEGTGLESRSGKEGAKYLCMSGKFEGAVTLKPRANDIVFRVKFSALDATKWKTVKAGLEEWRGEGQSIPKNLLEYRRKLGNEEQKAWKWANLIPLD